MIFKCFRCFSTFFKVKFLIFIILKAVQMVWNYKAMRMVLLLDISLWIFGYYLLFYFVRCLVNFHLLYFVPCFYVYFEYRLFFTMGHNLVVPTILNSLIYRLFYWSDCGFESLKDLVFVWWKYTFSYYGLCLFASLIANLLSLP